MFDNWRQKRLRNNFRVSRKSRRVVKFHLEDALRNWKLEFKIGKSIVKHLRDSPRTNQPHLVEKLRTEMERETQNGKFDCLMEVDDPVEYATDMTMQWETATGKHQDVAKEQKMKAERKTYPRNTKNFRKNQTLVSLLKEIADVDHVKK